MDRAHAHVYDHADSERPIAVPCSSRTAPSSDDGMPHVRSEGAGVGERERRWAAAYEHRERLLRLARARVGNPHDAEDCVQEAMVRAVEFDGLDEARLPQFLTTVTVRLCADVHRGRARGERLSRRLTGFWSHDPGPEESVCDRAESAWLSSRLDDLTPRQRAIIEARAEGLSCGAVAERLVVPYTTVESAMARVRRSLRVALESSLGLVAMPSWARLRRLLAGGATATAAALSVVSVTSAPDRAEPVALPPAQPGVVAGDQRDATAGEVAAVRSDAGSTVTTTRAATSSVVVREPARQHGGGGFEKAGRAFVGGTELPGGTDAVHHGYKRPERLMHCLEYGVAYGDTVQCRYPPGDPRNVEESTGTPGTGGAL